MGDTPSVSFDDIEGLSTRVSEEFGPWGEETEVGQDLIDAFADLSGDHQWIHTDVERAAKESPFGTTIAHGFLLLALLPRLRSEGVQVVGHSSAINYGAERLRFLAPVPSGSVIHGRTRLVGAEARSGGTLVTSERELAVVGAEKPSLLYRMQILYRGAARPA